MGILPEKSQYFHSWEEGAGGGGLGAAAVRLRKDARFTFEGKTALRDALRIKLDLTITGKLWRSSTSNLYQNSKQ